MSAPIASATACWPGVPVPQSPNTYMVTTSSVSGLSTSSRWASLYGTLFSLAYLVVRLPAQPMANAITSPMPVHSACRTKAAMYVPYPIDGCGHASRQTAHGPPV